MMNRDVSLIAFHQSPPVTYLASPHTTPGSGEMETLGCCLLHNLLVRTLHTSPHPHPHSIPITLAAPVLPIVDHCARGKIWNIAIKFPKQEALLRVLGTESSTKGKMAAAAGAMKKWCKTDTIFTVSEMWVCSIALSLSLIGSLSLLCFTSNCST